MKTLAVILSVCMVATIAATVAEGVQVHDAQRQVRDAQRQEQHQTLQGARQAKQLAADNRQISGLQGNVATLLGDVANPTDPLAAYTDVCNGQATNTSTGVMQTYYYPCTNVAQTTPEPGN